MAVVSSPIQWLVASTIDGIANMWFGYIDLLDVREDNERLLADNRRLRLELAGQREQVSENQRLRGLLGLAQQAPDVPYVVAEVISTSPSPLFRSIRIARGGDDGIVTGNAVVNYDGAVGRVVAVTDSSADVILLVDANHSTDVLVQRTRARARVRGRGRDGEVGIAVEHLGRTASVEPGDILITSGVGRSFPKGLPVGVVRTVEQSEFGLYQGAVVEPSVDFSRLEEVMVILQDWPTGSSFEALPEGGVSLQQ